MSNLLQGIVAATVLPFRDDGAPDLDSYSRFVDHLVIEGVGGLAINADSGEGMSLWPAERVDVGKAAVEAAAGRVPIVAGVMASFTDLACRNAEEAAGYGADALLVFPNAHLRGRPLDPEVPLRYLRRIHEASGLPIVAFQLQDDLGGVVYEPETLEAIVTSPFITAIKESTFDAYKFRRTMSLVRSVAPDVSFLSGNDNFIHESFVLGADGALIGAGSIATGLQVQMFDAVRRRDYEAAAGIAEKIEPLMVAVFGAPIRDYRARTKEGLVALGLFENASVREPLLDCPAEEADAVRQALVVAGLLESGE
ncbi:MAG: dihydrodipicolinate synthase family protein [Acidimicrobiales bacterium]